MHEIIIYYISIFIFPNRSESYFFSFKENGVNLSFTIKKWYEKEKKIVKKQNVKLLILKIFPHFIIYLDTEFKRMNKKNNE